MHLLQSVPPKHFQVDSISASISLEARCAYLFSKIRFDFSSMQVGYFSSVRLHSAVKRFLFPVDFIQHHQSLHFSSVRIDSTIDFISIRGCAFDSVEAIFLSARVHFILFQASVGFRIIISWCDFQSF